jgi:nitroreductase
VNVTDAVSSRSSIRAFADTPVDSELLKTLLKKSSRSASGGNLQPWRVFVLNGTTMPRFRDYLATQTEPETPAYAIYPQPLVEPYRSSRFKVGEDMYALMGIPREDKTARYSHLARNFNFFDAPAGFFLFVDKSMGPPQWSDLGMFLQTFMLLAKEAGLDTCAQEAWANRPRSVSQFVGAGDELMLFCGMAVGYRDLDAPVNTLISDREPFENWAVMVD